MAIIGLQRRFREVGRIRIGITAPTRSGKRAPRKLDKFRLTSPDRPVIEAAARAYGGTAKAWDNDGKAEWEVITDADELRVALPPNPTDLGFSQYYEQWAKGFASRRCDGERDEIHDAPCDCDPDNRACKATTRLTVLLPDIAGLGTWRLESHGYYAAVELGGAVELIEQLAGVRSIVPARLRLDHREVRRIIDGEAEVRKFVVPVIDLDVSITDVRQLAATTFTETAVPELDAPSGWKPVPAIEAPPPVLSVESQVLEAEKAKPRKKRANAAAPLPKTDRTPVKASGRPGTVCSICDKPYGAEPLTKNPGIGDSRFVHARCITDVELPSVEGDHPHEGDDDGGEGQSDGPRPVEPLPTIARADRSDLLTPDQRSKVHAMVAELFPTEQVGAGADDYRRTITLGLCDALGTPGLRTRAEIDKATATVLIDALEGIKRGELEYRAVAGQLIDTDSGAVIGFRKGTT
jgi:hypothetical protein